LQTDRSTDLNITDEQTIKELDKIINEEFYKIYENCMQEAHGISLTSLPIFGPASTLSIIFNDDK